LAFDGDKAGVAATERVIPIASSLGVNVTIISLPGGAKDPDELIKQDPELWRQAIGSAEPAVDWLFRQYSQREDLKAAAGKRAFTTAALAVVKGLHDPVEQDHYERLIASMVGSSVTAVKAKLAAAEAPAAKPLKRIVGPQAQDGTAIVFDHVDTLLGLALYRPAIRDVFAGTDPALFDDPRRQAVIRYLATHREAVSDELPEDLQGVDDYAKIIILRAEKRYEGWSEDDGRLEAAKLLRQYETEHQKQQLEQQIRSAEDRGDASEIERLRREHYVLMKEVKRG
jgi:DNA primase